jgi:glycosyltransferase involved in cell wall biosynthesis
VKSLHICYISQEYPPETGWGGVGTYTFEMAHGLVAQGHRVTVISLAVGKETITTEGNLEVHRVLPRPEWDRFKGLWRMNRYWPGFSYAAAARLKEIENRSHVDLVESAEVYADSLFVRARQPKARVIVRLHTPRIFVQALSRLKPTKPDRFIYWQEKRAILSARTLTAPTQAVVDLTKSWVPLNGRPVRVVPNPIDTRLFSPRPLKRELELLFVGRLEHRKIFTLYEALPDILRRNKDVRVRFAGAGSNDSTRSSWRTRILDSVPANDHPRLIFDRLERESAPEAYRRAAICVLPSIWENFPYALLEAMACGTPVVATKVGGFPELIEDGVSGILVPPESPAQLADAIVDLLKDPERRNQLGMNARRRVEEFFSTEQVIPAMLQVYQKVLNGSSRN